jgi:glyoxylase-like metal-dependent hydrolase (beta-lactamase superfamily II)
MARTDVRRELGRGERVMTGVWRLRLPLPLPGVPHANAWALADGDEIVLVDCGMHLPGSLANLERALTMVGLRLEQVRLLVGTHAHVDHWGQATTVVQRAGCEAWLHPDYRHATAAVDDPQRARARRWEIARHSGVPAAALRAYAAEHDRERRRDGICSGFAGFQAPDRALRAGMRVRTDLGELHVYETPGHAPSEVCLHQPEHRLLISGDHLLGRISQFFDYGWTPDPVGEFLASLEAVDTLDARLCLSGHGRTFTDVHAHVEGNRALVARRLDATRAALRDGPRSAYEVAGAIHGGELTADNATWWMADTLGFLTHLEAIGAVTRDRTEPERWALVREAAA